MVTNDATLVLESGNLALEQALTTEWLETDGLGGYASSTVFLCPTRRYHGLLVTRPEGSTKRHVFLSRFDECLRIGGDETAFSMARYPDVWAPPGHRALESFQLLPFPSSTYRIGEVELVREILMVRGKQAVLVRYRARGFDEPATLELRPLLPFREADALTMENDDLSPEVESIEGGLRCRPYAALPALSLTLGGTPHAFDTEPVWYKNVVHAADARRGYPDREDQFSPGKLVIELTPGEDVVLAVTIAEPIENPAALWKRESRHRRAAARDCREAKETALEARAALTVDDFLYRAPTGRLGVTAGFPWFGEWGRDTFIALPGLTLPQGRLDECAEVLSGTLEYLRDGLLPNVFGNGPEDSAYDSADAALWFARAVLLYEHAGGDDDRIVDEYLPALTEIAECYRDGTALDIRGDDGGLLHVGNAELNPTWMDARTEDGAVTPRFGCPVEINALWFSLLRQLELLSADIGDRTAERGWMNAKRLAKRSFLERFWLDDGDYLADVWRDGHTDRAVRPNMVIAASLEHSPLTRKHRAGVVARAEEELLTPKGLRTLSPRHPSYRGRYQGSPEARDGAYHQGTVWPWLLGFFVEAKLRASGAKSLKKKERLELAELWAGLEEELDRAGLNHVSEVFDGDAPHTPGGTIAQAWNTAELLRSCAMIVDGRP